MFKLSDHNGGQWRATEIPRGGGSKNTQFLTRWGGSFVMSFSRDEISTTGEFSKTNSCSVELAISYFTVNGLLKQELLFSSRIFY